MSVSEATRAKVLQRVAEGNVPTVLVLPSAVRADGAFYSDLDLEAKKVATAAGIDADFLDRPDERRLLGEYSAGFAATLAVAFLADLGVEGAVQVAKYVLHMVRRMVGRGLVAAPSDVSLTVSIERIQRVGSDFTVEGLSVTARGDQAMQQVLDVLAPALDPRSIGGLVEESVEPALADAASED